MNRPLKVFITYAHKDKTAKNELMTRLAVMQQERLITIWHDNEILPGDSWREAISNNLLASDILLYLVSATSLASENCNKELIEALGKASIRTVPIILEACDWQRHRISDFQALPDFGRPITDSRPASDGWQNVVEGIRRVVGAIHDSAQLAPETDSKRPDRRDAAEQFQFANVLMMLSQLDKAIETYSETIELDPRNAQAYNNRGVAKGGLGLHQESIADFDKAIHIDPTRDAAYNNRGIAKGQLGRFQESIADFDQAIHIDPRPDNAYYNRGIAKSQLGRYDEAIADYDQAIRINPQNATAYFNRGTVKGRLGQSQEAIADFDQAIRIDPQDATTYFNRGIAKFQLGRYDEAIADFDQAIRIDPQNAKAYFNRGIAKFRLGQRDEAIADYAQAISIDPQLARPTT